MRLPSIHITEERLAILIREVLPDFSNVSEALAKDIVNRAKTHSLSSRSIYASNEKMHQKTEKIKLVGRSETGIFAQMLHMTRRKMHHRGIQLIGPNDKDWVNLKETAKLATDFCNEFSLPIKDGYQQYLNIGFDKMKNFSIYKFKSIHSAICKYYEAYQEILQDPTPEQTKKYYHYYTAKINERIGNIGEDLNKNPEKYLGFVKAKLEGNRLLLTAKEYIDAQFEAMEWANTIPDPLQLYGEKALERVQRYCYKHGISLRKPDKGLSFKKFR